MLSVLESLIRRKDQLATVALVVIYRFLLDLSYVKIASVVFTYVGYEYSPRGLAYVAISYLFTIVLAALFSPNLASVSRVIGFYLFLFTYVPVSTLFAVNKVFSPVPYFIMTLCFFLLFLGIRVRIPRPQNSPVFRFKKGYAVTFSIIASGIILAILLAKYGIPTQIPSLSEVYEVRGPYKESVSRFIGYIVRWQGNVLNVFLFMTGVLSRSVLLMTGAVAFQMYLYSITGLKSFFFSFLFLIWLVIGLRFFRFHLAQYLSGTGCISLIAIFLSANIVKDWVMLPAIFLNRLYFVPAQLFYYYYDYFSSHYFDWFAQNLPFSLFSNSNYKIPIPNVIGDYYFGGADVASNANLFADGYANLGFAGNLLVTLVLIAVLHGLDILSVGKNRYLVLSLVAIPMFSLTNSSLFTALLTHGFLIAMMIIFLLPEEGCDWG